MSETIDDIAPLTDDEAEAAFTALVEALDTMGGVPAATVASKEDEGVSFSLHYSATRARQLIASRAAIEATTVKGDGLDASAKTMTVPTYDQCDTYVAGQYMFNYLRTFLAMAGIDASTCRLVIELPDRDTQRQLVSAVQRDSKGPPCSAGKIGNHSGFWQGVEYEFSVKGWNAKSRAFGYEVADGQAADTITTLKGEIERRDAALRPFAAMAEWLDNTDTKRDAIYCGGSPGLRCQVTQADYHRARQALSQGTDNVG